MKVNKSQHRAQSDAKRQEVHPFSQPDQKRMPARHKRVPNPVQFSNDNVEIQRQIRDIQLRENRQFGIRPSRSEQPEQVDGRQSAAQLRLARLISLKTSRS